MINRVTLVGYVGNDPDIRAAGDKLAANFSVATSSAWRDKTTGEKKEDVEWHNISCFDARAKLVQDNLKKGMLVYIEGRIQLQKWTNKAGEERVDKKIMMDEIKFLGGKSDKKTNDNTANAYNNSGSASSNDDDIPF